MDKPICTDMRVQTSRGGKIAIVDYGKNVSDWSLSMSRSYAIPEGMSDEEIDAFQVSVYDSLVALIEPLDQAEYDERYEQREWE